MARSLLSYGQSYASPSRVPSECSILAEFPSRRPTCAQSPAPGRLPHRRQDQPHVDGGHPRRRARLRHRHHLPSRLRRCGLLRRRASGPRQYVLHGGDRHDGSRHCRRLRYAGPLLAHGLQFVHQPHAARGHRLDGGFRTATGGRVLPQDWSRLLARLVRRLVHHRRHRAAGRAPGGRQLCAPLDAAGPPLSPCRHLRRWRHLREADRRARDRRRQRHPHHRRVRRPQRRPR